MGEKLYSSLTTIGVRDEQRRKSARYSNGKESERKEPRKIEVTYLERVHIPQ